MSSSAAVVGSGPAGFYATDHLLDAGFEVDLYDALPTPFGLVRAGVAPDHPKIKSVTRVFDKTAAKPGFRFFGGVQVGTDITRAELLERYDAVVYAVGTSADNRLGIAGEQRPGCHAATEFVAWYNGHPEFCDHAFDLSVGRAVVIGHGNVALDVARMLVLEPEEVSATDTATHATEALLRANVDHVTVLGRRGPAQAAFTNPELLELGELRRADVVVDPSEVDLDAHSTAWLASDAAGAASRRRLEILREYAERPARGGTHRIELKFLRSPVEVLGEHQHGAVRALEVVRNRIEPGPDGSLRAVATGERERIECGLVLRSIGYRGRPLPGVPFDERRGLIPNKDGRVTELDGEVLTGEYVAGWIKRGPSGVIGTNKKDAAETVKRIVEDRDAALLREPPRRDRAAIESWLRSRVPGVVAWAGWQAIDDHETAAGLPLGRPRVKLVRVSEMRQLAAGATAR